MIRKPINSLKLWRSAIERSGPACLGSVGVDNLVGGFAHSYPLGRGRQ